MECPQGCRSAELTAREEARGHAQLQAMAGTIEDAAAGNQVAVQRFLDHGEAYIGLLMKYIENEEDWLFRQTNRLLDKEAERRLAGEFQKTGTKTACGRCSEQYISIADRLADHFGVPRAELLDA
jgi:hemerythrin-like domain-containing protein